jgi:hypothetical protein
MEEQETPLEDVHENIHEHAENTREGWVMGVAVSTALIAAVAAIASLLSGDNVNEAMMKQIRASDTWGRYQAKSIKAVELTTRIALLEANGKIVPDSNRKKIEEYAKDQDTIKAQAEDLERETEAHMRRHHVIAKSVTWSQIAIAISAIAVLTRQKWFWGLGLAFGAAGLVFLLWGVAI